MFRLAPHESPTTDVVLLGHSMGGLLAAEIVLKSPVPPTGQHAFSHRILGTINFDTPFLGMHPGVISSGLASLFRSPDEPEVKPQNDGSSGVVSPSTASLHSPSTATIGSGDGSALSPTSSVTSTSTVSRPGRQDTLFSPAGSDPTFNPKFNNDVNLPIRKGWEKTLHFLNKHSKHMVKAGQQYVKSHLEFGGAMADYPALKQRYVRIRTLEDEDESQRASGQGGRIPKPTPIPRVRFVNYYTASTGRPKKEKSRSRSRSKAREDEDKESQTLNPPDTATTASRSNSRSPSVSPRISIEEHRDDGSVEKKEAIVPETPKEENDEDHDSESTFEIDDADSIVAGPASIPNLPPLPPLPMEPAPPNLDLYTDKDVKKAVQREHDRAVKGYKKAVKNHERALKDRAKIEAKYKKRMEKSAASSKETDKPKKEPEAKGDTTTQKKDKGKGQAIASPTDDDTTKAPSEVSTSTAQTAPSIPPASNDVKQETQTSAEAVDTDDEEAAILARYRTAESALLSSNQPKPVLTPLETNTSATGSELDRGRTLSPAPSQASAIVEKGKPQKAKKDKKFCTLPSKASDGSRDPTWIRVFMRDVDEVGAHCGLFLQEGKNGATYEMLVGEVSAKVEEWVREDMSTRYVAAGGH